MILHHPLALIALTCAALSATILIGFLVRRPLLVGSTKLWLLLGLGVFPLGVATAGNAAGFEATKERKFCGSCHVMVPHASDSNDLKSTSLASRHARNNLFGEQNCYVCHADYGMFGTILTKLGGMRHVYEYVTRYRNVSLEAAKETIHLYKPYPNSNCMQCHSTNLELWMNVPDHKSSLAEVREGRVSCASAGCHGFAHPFTKPAASVSPASHRSPERAPHETRETP
ncbi:MAG TPA: NapC/NirT family cytochrome c [Polyangiaceae bacterium]|nr:NapC/NirT family cytochrome c [Polyangiaceae bacterium]